MRNGVKPPYMLLSAENLGPIQKSKPETFIKKKYMI